ncbi:MAG: DNA polymerase III subunit delta [Alistipes sp.]|jgi:DNA polymerase-3 subunit delta'|nr:DNA polymerase III subunit delta [Alistipes sp.]MBQ5923938.1 DNA polymerase III subunit delta [Alistipes sp.]MEE1148221.1 DNA polymerase III subunit delta [Alistipes sp.]
MRFADIIGHDALKARLRAQIDAGRVSHAQLFTGDAGYGSLPLALAYVQYLFCPHRHDGDSCGECPSCQQIEALAHPDLHFVYPVNKREKKAGEVVISDMFIDKWRAIWQRNSGIFSAEEWYSDLDLGKTMKGLISAKESEEIIRKLQFKSYSSEYKAMIIWLPEAMNQEAANKILKILEEPWEKTLFILVSEQPELLLQTITSRTQEVTVGRIDVATLQGVAMREGKAQDVAHNIARLAGGSMLELRELLRGATDESRALSFELFTRLMRLSYNDKHLELFEWADDIAALTREGQRQFFLHAVRLLRESYMLHAGLGAISYLWGEERDFCVKFAPFIGNQNIEILVEEIERAMLQIQQNGSPRIVFTHFALAVSKQINRLK